MRRAAALVLAVLFILSVGCQKKPVDVDLDVKLGFIDVPVIANDMGTRDTKELRVIVENNENRVVEGLTVAVIHAIPNFQVTPTRAKVIPLGPKGSSKNSPAVFTLKTLGTPPGKYSFTVVVEYGGVIVKSKEVKIDVK
jgi:hypothetical protein